MLKWSKGKGKKMKFELLVLVLLQALGLGNGACTTVGKTNAPTGTHSPTVEPCVVTLLGVWYNLDPSLCQGCPEEYTSVGLCGLISVTKTNEPTNPANTRTPTSEPSPAPTETLVIDGYYPESDIRQHLNIAYDQLGFSHWLGGYSLTGEVQQNDIDWVRAMNIYSNGMHSVKSSSFLRTIRSFSTEADVKMSDEEIYVIYRNYHGIRYADRLVSAALGGTGVFQGRSMKARAAAATLGTVVLHVWMYVIHEMEDSIADCEANDLEQNDDQGVRAWDEAFAFYSGALVCKDGCCSGNLLYHLTEEMCQSFQTCDGQRPNDVIIKLFNQGKILLQQGMCDQVGPVKDLIVTRMLLPLLQGLLKHGHAAANGADSERAVSRARGMMYAASVLPLIHRVKPVVALNIEHLIGFYSDEQVDYEALKSEVQSSYAALGVKCDEVGAQSIDDSNVECFDSTFSPTESPTTAAPTKEPTLHPTARPTASPVEFSCATLDKLATCNKVLNCRWYKRECTVRPCSGRKKPGCELDNVCELVGNKCKKVTITQSPTTAAPSSRPSSSPISINTARPTTGEPTWSPTLSPTLSPTAFRCELLDGKKPKCKANKQCRYANRKCKLRPCSTRGGAICAADDLCAMVGNKCRDVTAAPSLLPSRSPSATPTRFPTTLAPTRSPSSSSPTSSPSSSPVEFDCASFHGSKRNCKKFDQCFFQRKKCKVKPCKKRKLKHCLLDSVCQVIDNKCIDV